MSVLPRKVTESAKFQRFWRVINTDLSDLNYASFERFFARVYRIYRANSPALFLLFWVAYGFAFFLNREAPNPDAFYHMGVVDEYAKNGWISDFKWLPWTTLNEGFPNLYILSHALLIPLTWIFDLDDQILVAMYLTGFATCTGVYMVVSRMTKSDPLLWSIAAVIALPTVFAYVRFLKGAGVFVALLPWLILSIWRGHWIRTAVLSMISTWTYLGIVVLLPLGFARSLAAWNWNKKRDHRQLMGICIGIVVGLILHPAGVLNVLPHMGRELLTTVYFPAELTLGTWVGVEWANLQGRALVENLVPLTATVGMAALLFTRRDMSLDEGSGAALIALLGFLLAAFWGSTKFVAMAGFVALILAPVLLDRMRQYKLKWPTRTVAALIVVAFLYHATPQAYAYYLYLSGQAEPQHTLAKHRAFAEQVKELARPGEVVLAPWDTFPHLFYYNRDNRYVAGLNMMFLRAYKKDAKKFAAYFHLYGGRLSDPERGIPLFFDNARIVLTRSRGTPGDVALVKRLESKPEYFERHTEQAGYDYWHIYIRNENAPLPDLEAKPSEEAGATDSDATPSVNVDDIDNDANISIEASQSLVPVGLEEGISTGGSLTPDAGIASGKEGVVNQSNLNYQVETGLLDALLGIGEETEEAPTETNEGTATNNAP